MSALMIIMEAKARLLKKVLCFPPCMLNLSGPAQPPSPSPRALGSSPTAITVISSERLAGEGGRRRRTLAQLTCSRWTLRLVGASTAPATDLLLGILQRCQGNACRVSPAKSRGEVAVLRVSRLTGGEEGDPKSEASCLSPPALSRPIHPHLPTAQSLLGSWERVVYGRWTQQIQGRAGGSQGFRRTLATDSCVRRQGT